MIRAKKSLGQNFLVDQNIIQKIIGTADIEGKEILEVGPGTGNLTNEILKANPKKLYLIEKDNELSISLKNKYNDKISLYNEDILNFNTQSLSKNKLTVFGNLPYNISTEILCNWIINLTDENCWFEELILMFQKEVADRIIANYNTSAYGRLAILANWRLNIKKVCDISPECFSPKPKVDSSLLYFVPKNNFVRIKDPKNIEKISRVFFSQRRKMLKKPYNQIFNGDQKILDTLKIDLNLRPQNLNFDTYYQLTCEYEKLRS
ncbi:16S rRNA (adenine(1518)-N(6)/adenine(1519)-N(6))-dimethyltransferase RsmA [Candidatus Pelagibacter bacterium nBUS_27]|uniref:16S rRNA (adenine(1518)-N(6)/adenine(1519)-N(6))- dimethyltransferase RsmA n=1 Tax=Candidatus Pelagibacter bacterium nBUS_27 TaxID=3374188 RepID=UPI003EB7F248